MEHFYDGQIRKYIVQIIRMFNNLSYKTGNGNIIQIPVMYGDMTRQVASIIKNNSENTVPTAPRMAVYITGLEIDRERASDASYVNKKHIRERAYDEEGKEYLTEQGKNYTIERIMPTPYKLSINVDVWSTTTDQKLQILEQILMLFNPSLEIQTSDNYLDWTSLSVVYLESIQFSSRSIPTGTETEIDVATLSFSTPIFISMPAKVKKLGVIKNIITQVLNVNYDTDTELSSSAFYTGSLSKDIKQELNIPNLDESLDISEYVTRSFRDWEHSFGYDLLVLNNTAKLVKDGMILDKTWTEFFLEISENINQGIAYIFLKKPNFENNIIGKIEINPADEHQLLIKFDLDTVPSNTVLNGPVRNLNQLSTIDYAINPQDFNPTDIKIPGLRLLLLDSIGSDSNTDGADAWKNSDGTDLVVDKNSIIEWDGFEWRTILVPRLTDAGNIFLTNLKTGLQIFWDGKDWLLSIDGEYRKGDWSIRIYG